MEASFLAPRFPKCPDNSNKKKLFPTVSRTKWVFKPIFVFLGGSKCRDSTVDGCLTIFEQVFLTTITFSHLVVVFESINLPVNTI